MKNKLITAMFVAYILIFSVGSIILKDREFSEMENRNLEQFPEVSRETILDGSFSENFESYMSDQIIFKDWLVKLKVEENLALGQTNVNGVFFSDYGMLIQEYDEPYDQLTKNLQYVNEFVDNNPDFSCVWLLIPNACYIYSERLPRYAECYPQDEVMEYIKSNVSDKIQTVDITDALMEHKQAELYYKTDHHWTIFGAYIGYSELCKALGVNATPSYECTQVSEDFYGTQYSNAPTFNQEPDSIEVYINPKGSYTVEYIDTDTVSDSLYNYDNLENKDKYTVYLDGNHSIIKITSNGIRMNPNQETKKLLVVKDSYAHCLLPMLADQFSEIYVVDLRYYHDSVSELAEEQGINKIVFINNLEFLSTDNNFLWLQ